MGKRRNKLCKSSRYASIEKKKTFTGEQKQMEFEKELELEVSDIDTVSDIHSRMIGYCKSRCLPLCEEMDIDIFHKYVEFLEEE